MGHLINPNSFRMGISKFSDIRWSVYHNKNYKYILVKDLSFVYIFDYLVQLFYNYRTIYSYFMDYKLFRYSNGSQKIFMHYLMDDFPCFKDATNRTFLSRFLLLTFRSFLRTTYFMYQSMECHPADLLSMRLFLKDFFIPQARLDFSRLLKIRLSLFIKTYLFLWNSFKNFILPYRGIFRKDTKQAFLKKFKSKRRMLTQKNKKEKCIRIGKFLEPFKNMFFEFLMKSGSRDMSFKLLKYMKTFWHLSFFRNIMLRVLMIRHNIFKRAAKGSSFYLRNMVEDKFFDNYPINAFPISIVTKNFLRSNAGLFLSKNQFKNSRRLLSNLFFYKGLALQKWLQYFIWKNKLNLSILESSSSSYLCNNNKYLQEFKLNEKINKLYKYFRNKVYYWRLRKNLRYIYIHTRLLLQQIFFWKSFKMVEFLTEFMRLKLFYFIFCPGVFSDLNNVRFYVFFFQLMYNPWIYKVRHGHHFIWDNFFFSGLSKIMSGSQNFLDKRGKSLRVFGLRYMRFILGSTVIWAKQFGRKLLRKGSVFSLFWKYNFFSSSLLMKKFLFLNLLPLFYKVVTVPVLISKKFSKYNHYLLLYKMHSFFQKKCILFNNINQLFKLFKVREYFFYRVWFLYKRYKGFYSSFFDKNIKNIRYIFYLKNLQIYYYLYFNKLSRYSSNNCLRKLREYVIRLNDKFYFRFGKKSLNLRKSLRLNVPSSGPQYLFSQRHKRYVYKSWRKGLYKHHRNYIRAVRKALFKYDSWFVKRAAHPFTYNSAFLGRFIGKGIAMKLDIYVILRYIYKQSKFFGKSGFIKGFRLKLVGRFSRRSRKHMLLYNFGVVSYSNLSVPLDYFQDFIITEYGVAGLKVWLYLPLLCSELLVSRKLLYTLN